MRIRSGLSAISRGPGIPLTPSSNFQLLAYLPLPLLRNGSSSWPITRTLLNIILIAAPFHCSTIYFYLVRLCTPMYELFFIPCFFLVCELLLFICALSQSFVRFLHLELIFECFDRHASFCPDVLFFVRGLASSVRRRSISPLAHFTTFFAFAAIAVCTLTSSCKDFVVLALGVGLGFVTP